MEGASGVMERAEKAIVEGQKVTGCEGNTGRYY